MNVWGKMVQQYGKHITMVHNAVCTIALGHMISGIKSPVAIMHDLIQGQVVASVCRSQLDGTLLMTQ
jgi:Cu/Ag efflux protein CusF